MKLWIYVDARGREHISRHFGEECQLDVKSSSVAVVSWDHFLHRVAFSYSLHHLIFRKKSLRRTASYHYGCLWMVFFFGWLYNSSHLHNLMVFHQTNKNNKLTALLHRFFYFFFFFFTWRLKLFQECVVFICVTRRETCTLYRVLRLHLIVWKQRKSHSWNFHSWQLNVYVRSQVHIWKEKNTSSKEKKHLLAQFYFGCTSPFSTLLRIQ